MAEAKTQQAGDFDVIFAGDFNLIIDSPLPRSSTSKF